MEAAMESAGQGGGIKPGSARAWVMAIRLPTLTAALSPVMVGSAVAHAVGGFRLPVALISLFSACMIQIATNFANDVFDSEKGADTKERLGPPRAVQMGLLTPREVRVGMAVTVALAMLSGLYLIAVGGWPILAIGVLSLISGVAYTGGPYPLGYHGLGDVFVMIFFGFVAVCGTVFVQAGAVPPLAWVAAAPMGAIATCVLIVNNVRDRHTDVKAGKRTLAVRFGKAACLVEYGLLIAVAYASPIVAVTLLGRSPWALLPLASLPIAVALLRRLSREEGRPLNATLFATAKLVLIFAALFSAGLVIPSLRG